MSNLPRFAAGVVLSLTLAGCANADLGPKQTVGTLLGAGTGTLLGAYLGNEAGKSLDRADALYASRAEHQALEYTPSGNSTPWRNPDSGHYGSITPIETFESTDGAYCREFQHQAQPRRLRHRVSHPGRPMAGGALSEAAPARVGPHDEVCRDRSARRRQRSRRAEPRGSRQRSDDEAAERIRRRR